MVCIGPYDITIDELLSGNEGRGKKKLDIAENFIKEYFGTTKEIASNEIILERMQLYYLIESKHLCHHSDYLLQP